MSRNRRRRRRGKTRRAGGKRVLVLKSPKDKRGKPGGYERREDATRVHHAVSYRSEGPRLADRRSVERRTTNSGLSTTVSGLGGVFVFRTASAMRAACSPISR